MAALEGRMMQMPLLISSLVRHAARHGADTATGKVQKLRLRE
jgi:hypothetical protein